MYRFTFLVVACALGFGLGPAAAESPKPADSFGAALTLEEATPLASVLANAERYTSEPVLIHGRLSDVCQRKGCWTVIQDEGAHVRVRFKDYGFFIPKDATGREAFVEGIVTIETLSEDEARHYESESRDGDPDSVKGPQRQVGFMASGVRLIQK
jgi:hypothetical protein